MVLKVKESFEKTRHDKNNDKSKKYILRGQRNVRYHDRILSSKKNLIIQHNSVISTCLRYVDFLEDYNRYRAEIFRVH